MKPTILGLAGLLLGLLVWPAPESAAQTCCQYGGACADIQAGPAAVACTEGGGQPTTGACLPAHGLCEGTVVCCDTTCRGEQSCSSMTAGDCAAIDMAIPHAGATCGADGACVGECSQGCAAPGHVYCDGECVDLARHADHCGECGHVCHDDERCVEGECQRTGVLRNLGPGSGGGSSPVTKLPLPFGDVVRNPRQLPSIVDSGWFACYERYGYSARICDGECVSVQTDEHHCGECGNECGPGAACEPRAGYFYVPAPPFYYERGECGTFHLPEGAYCSESPECESHCCSLASDRCVLAGLNGSYSQCK